MGENNKKSFFRSHFRVALSNKTIIIRFNGLWMHKSTEIT